MSKKPFIILLLCIAFSFGVFFSYGMPADAAADKTDPLVTVSWVDQYVESAFAPLEARLAAVEEKLDALSGGTTILLTIGSSTYSVNGANRTMDTAPIINSNGRTLVPVRFVAEALGAKVDWTADQWGRTKTVIIKEGTKEVILTIGSSTYSVDGGSRTMDTAPIINSDGRTLVPVRFVAEALGAKVDWTANQWGYTETVIIKK